MVKRMNTKDQLLTRAEKAFKSAETRDIASKQITQAEYATAAVKTKTLRALRLAQEATDASAKDLNPTPSPDTANRRKRR